MVTVAQPVRRRRRRRGRAAAAMAVPAIVVSLVALIRLLRGDGVRRSDYYPLLRDDSKFVVATAVRPGDSSDGDDGPSRRASLAASSDGGDDYDDEEADEELDAAILADEAEAVLPPPKCTQHQLETILAQLPPDDCEEYADKPASQRCSFSYATRCPDSVWIDEHYRRLHESDGGGAGRQIGGEGRSFTAVFVGCNKGMDAVNALRMGSGDPAFDLARWREAMNVTDDDGVCHQARASAQFQLPSRDNDGDEDETDVHSDDSTASSSRVFCIEPMPATYRALSKSASLLGYDEKGLTVTHAAVSRVDGTIPFPDGTRAGSEGKSIEHCAKSREGCVDVRMYSLDAYVEEFVEEGDGIDYLSVDVEGFDGDVLLGAKNVLGRVRYLEFEYNWMGSWRNQTLSSITTLLDEEHGFTCYWPGLRGAIWRITNCFLDHYDLKFWSNVACVNRNAPEARPIAERMEELFMQTLERGEDVAMTWENRRRIRWWRMGKDYPGDDEGDSGEKKAGRRRRGRREGDGR